MTMKPLLIYLDQNKWINLNGAYHNLPNGMRFKTILECIKLAAKNGTAIFPLSDVHVIETRKAKDLTHRRRLAQVMVEISQGWTLAPASHLVPQQLRVAIASLYGEQTQPEPAALGRGIPFAFGQAENLHIDLGLSKGEAKHLQAILDSPHGLAAFLVGNDESLSAQGVIDFERRAHLLGDKVERARAVGKAYSKAERKRAYVAELTYHLQPELTQVLALYGKTLRNLLDLGKSRLTAFFEQVPTLHVEVELATERDDFWNRLVDPNDMVDVSFLSVAIPYCDIVVTEKFWTDLAKRKKLGQRYETVVLSDLFDLESHLGL